MVGYVCHRSASVIINVQTVSAVLMGAVLSGKTFAQLDVDCADGSQICEDQRCVSPNGACADRDDCDGAYCIDGNCTEAFSCTNNRTCRQIAGFLRCIDGECRTSSTDCVNNCRLHYRKQLCVWDLFTDGNQRVCSRQRL